MNSELKENKLEGNDTGRLKDYLNSERCINAGVVLISENNNKVKLGAMNPIYEKVLNIVEELKVKFSSEVEVTQITAEEWEKWTVEVSFFDTQNQDKSSINSSNSKKESIPEEVKVQKKTKENSKSLLEEVVKDEFSSKLIEKQDDKFDFFDIDESEDEDELDIIEESEFENNDDPVIKAAGSILSTCSKLKASDIHAEPLEDRMRIRYRIDGVLKEVYSLPKPKSKAITSRLKVLSKLDIA